MLQYCNAVTDRILALCIIFLRAVVLEEGMEGVVETSKELDEKIIACSG